MDISGILFLGTKDSVRSQMCQSILNHMYGSRFSAFSAGCQVSKEDYPETYGVHPFTLEALRLYNYPADDVFAHTVETFLAGKNGYQVIISLSREARDYVANHPELSGENIITAYWKLPDPANAKGDPDEVRESFHYTLRIIRSMIEMFVSLPVEVLGKGSLQKRIESIGNVADSDA